MLSFECIKNEKSVYFLLTSAQRNKKPAGSQYKPTKSKWVYPVYIKKNRKRPIRGCIEISGCCM